MFDDMHDNQRFIDAAKSRGEDTLMYMDAKSGECLLVSGSASSIKLLGEIVDDYEMVCEMVCEVVEGVAAEMDCQRQENSDYMLNGESEHAN